MTVALMLKNFLNFLNFQENNPPPPPHKKKRKEKRKTKFLRFIKRKSFLTATGLEPRTT